MQEKAFKVLVIGGPTASGKSGLALSAALQSNGAIINADSMQLYDGLGLLTAQPSAAEQAQAPHLLYAGLAPDDICSAARWRGLALAAIETALQQRRLPIIVGGTGFYIKTLVKGISPIPSVPPDVRMGIIARRQEIGTPALYAELQARDPAMAAKLEPGNTQRLVRALEVLEATGKSLAEWQELPPAPPPAHLRFVTAALLPPREQLYAQCDKRFGDMLKAGALDEVREFMKTATDDMPLTKALGYGELKQHLEGALSLADAAAQAQMATRRYAKRQVTWFRHQMAADIVLEAPDARKLLDA
ncbi:MAG: tRNA (adenosine(37)-N6)-dimethylallyltransferase MiaA [Micavibrio sp.]|nr:tRNA (adenosine(37)-N6)-dimethylallyltransferase MiaA [Micavibrio sp.]